MLRMISWSIVIWIMTLVAATLGCGPSGRELSDEQWLALQAAIQHERAEVGQQRDQLEADRRAWDARERSDAVVAAAISSGAMLICCTLPLIVLTLLIWPRQPEPADAIVSTLLIQDLAHQAEGNGDGNGDGNDPERLGSSPCRRRLGAKRS